MRKRRRGVWSICSSCRCFSTREREMCGNSVKKTRVRRIQEVKALQLRRTICFWMGISRNHLLGGKMRFMVCFPAPCGCGCGCNSDVFAHSSMKPGRALKSLDAATLDRGFQVQDSNPMVGVSSRCQLLVRLGESLVSLPEIFGVDARPGNVVGEWSRSSFL